MIYPNSGLVAVAAKSISRFLTSSNANLKYLGITALASIVKVDPSHAAPHQMVVIDCLENPDETIKRKVCVGMGAGVAASAHWRPLVPFLKKTAVDSAREAGGLVAHVRRSICSTR